MWPSVVTLEKIVIKSLPSQHEGLSQTGNIAIFVEKTGILVRFTNFSGAFYAVAHQNLKECNLGKQHRATAKGKTLWARSL